MSTEFPECLIEYRRSDAKGHTVLRIPSWLYRREFDKDMKR